MSNAPTRKSALQYCSALLDDSLNVRSGISGEVRDDAVLVGWQCGFESMFVAVQSYLPGVTLSEEDAVEIAKDWLKEVEWFSGEPTDPDYIITGTGE